MRHHLSATIAVLALVGFLALTVACVQAVWPKVKRMYIEWAQPAAVIGGVHSVQDVTTDAHRVLHLSSLSRERDPTSTSSKQGALGLNPGESDFESRIIRGGL